VFEYITLRFPAFYPDWEGLQKPPSHEKRWRRAFGTLHPNDVLKNTKFVGKCVKLGEVLIFLKTRITQSI
jgi:hypothetical protein